MKKNIFVFLLAITLVACSSNLEKDVSEKEIIKKESLEKEVLAEKLPEKEIVKKENSELVITDTKIGTGDIVKSGDFLKIHYKGTFLDGTEFDSSYSRGEPFSVTIGTGQVIPGWDQGIIGMQVGGKRTLVIPAELAYGEKSVGIIPPNSSLKFEVELVAIVQPDFLKQ